MMQTPRVFAKRCVDIFLSSLGLSLLFPIIFFSWAVARIDTQASGMFTQVRIGKDGRPFGILKIRTMRRLPGAVTTISVRGDPRITLVGQVFRTLKVDELPQLWNVLVGEMSLVGPRPDVPGYADQLTGRERMILTVRPGITGPAQLAYRGEEALLARQANPELYNDEVIWPEKVKINLNYVNNWTLVGDFRYLWKTIIR